MGPRQPWIGAIRGIGGLAFVAATAPDVSFADVPDAPAPQSTEFERKQRDPTGYLVDVGSLSGFRRANPDQPKSICGTKEDFFHVRHLDDYTVEQVAAVTGALLHKSSGQIFCSGVQVSRNEFVTASHCVDAYIEQDAVIVFEHELGLNGAPVNEDPVEHTFTLHIDGFPSGIDYAVLQLDSPRELSAPTRYHDVRSEQTVGVLQFPRGGYKQVAFGRVGRLWSRAGVFGYSDLDTDPSSSGGPVFDHHSGVLLGIHTRGACHQDGENYGVAFSTIVRDYSRRGAR